MVFTLIFRHARWYNIESLSSPIYLYMPVLPDHKCSFNGENAWQSALISNRPKLTEVRSFRELFILVSLFDSRYTSDQLHIHVKLLPLDTPTAYGPMLKPTDLFPTRALTATQL